MKKKRNAGVGSWVVTRRSDGHVIGEFFDRKNVNKFDPKKVRIETAAEYLGRINAAIKARGGRSNPTTSRSKYRRFVIPGRSKSQFVKSTFRTIPIGKRGNKALVACLKQRWDSRRKRCKKGMRAYELLIKKGQRAPRVSRLRKKR